MKPEIRPLPRVWLASLCLGAISFPGSLVAAEQVPAPVAAEKAVPQTEETAYEAILALKPGKGDAEMVRLGPAFLEKYPGSAHSEKVAELNGEALMRKEDWKAARECYLRLAGSFPKSVRMERFKFQAAVCRLKMNEPKDAALELEQFLKDYPASGLTEEATYQAAMAHFLDNDYKGTLLGCRNYLKDYPAGKHTGDVIYRLAFIDANDKTTDQSENIIRNLEDFIRKNPADPALGSLRCLLGDTWLKRKPTAGVSPAATAKEIRANEDAALGHYRKAAVSLSSVDDVAEYAHKAAEGLMTKRGETQALTEFQAECRKRLEARLQQMKEEEGE